MFVRLLIVSLLKVSSFSYLNILLWNLSIPGTRGTASGVVTLKGVFV